MRTIEPWVEPPLREFLRESSARLVLVMTSSGQVVAQYGFTRSLDVMAAASLGAAIVASTEELARVMKAGSFGNIAHQNAGRGVFLAPFPMHSGRWIGLVVFDHETSHGLVQLFFGQFAAELRAAAPIQRKEAVLLAEQFEDELNRSLRSLFGR